MFELRTICTCSNPQAFFLGVLCGKVRHGMARRGHGHGYVGGSAGNDYEMKTTATMTTVIACPASLLHVGATTNTYTSRFVRVVIAQGPC